jgi:16S rRNA (cytosine1402-N4)-methyltransferase
MKMSDGYHEPVLLAESIDALKINPAGVYVDLTFGGGGHSRAVLEKLGKSGRLIGFDQDENAFSNALEDDRFAFVPANFRFFGKFLNFLKEERVDGVLADLGISSHQIDVPERGFSYRLEGPLDMRMNKSLKVSAKELLLERDARELQRIFGEYGEIRNSKTLAEWIVKNRKSHLLKTSGDLVRLIEPVIRGERKRYLSQLFQALRIEVNEEMEALAEMLTQLEAHLKPGGRIVVISYHSLEDRMVKNLFKTGNVEGELIKNAFGVIETPFRIINKKPIIPSTAEIARNPRSRSAKLRIAERI